MDCPACGHDVSTVLQTTRWPGVDQRKNECLKCKFRYRTTTMLIDDEAILVAAANVSKVTRKLMDSNGKPHPDTFKPDPFSFLNQILEKIESLEKAVINGSEKT